MTTINGLPYYEVVFTADGNPDPTTGADALRAAVSAGGITDLFVLSHGWNNGVDSARNLYQGMFRLLADQLGDRRTRCAAVGVMWPSLLFPDDDPATAPPVPSTGAQLAAALAPAFPDQHQHLAAIGQLLDEQPQQPDKLTEFHSLATQLVTTPGQSAEDEGEAALLTADPNTVLTHAAAMAPAADDDAQGIGNPFTALWSGAREVLRTMSYYEMKNRAGVVGTNGLGPLLASLTGVRIHLIGHSFGARLVSYALSGLPGTATGAASPVKSLTLIRGHSRTSRSPLHRRSTAPAAVAWPASDAGSTVRWWRPSRRPTGPSAGGIPPRACWPARTVRPTTMCSTAGGRWGTTGTSRTRRR